MISPFAELTLEERTYLRTVLRQARRRDEKKVESLMTKFGSGVDLENLVRKLKVNDDLVDRLRQADAENYKRQAADGRPTVDRLSCG